MPSKNTKKNIWYLGWTSFFTDVSSEMIFPILPIFLTTVLKANMAVIGLIEGIAESASAFLKLISGWFSDKFGKKKPLVIAGYSLSTITKPLLALSTHWTHVLGVRVFDRVGKGIRTAPRDALIAASTAKKERGKGFGLHRTLDTSGAIVGTLIAFFILQKFFEDAFRLIFWLSFIPGLIAVLILIFAVKESKVREEKKYSFDFNNLNPNLKRFLFVILLFNLANFSYAFFILRAQDIGLLIALIPLVYLVYNLFYAFFSIPAGKLSDIVGRKSVLSVGFLLFGMTSLGFAFFANTMTVWFLFALYGLFMAVTDGVSRAYVSDLSTKEERGTTLGAYHTIVGITVLPANFIGGLLWYNINVFAPFVYAAILSITASLLLVVLVRKK
jgi:MFS family permease